jgi:radical SAM protein with 4Fe4S-binding SPASM domain
MSSDIAQARQPALRSVGLLIEKWAGMAKFRGYRRSASILYRLALACAPDLPSSRRELAKSKPRRAGDPPHLASLVLGTTGTCNASCIHCPTGKASTANAPRGTMSMHLFRKIVDGIAEEGLAIDHVGFGLFGDGLVDPLVVERARYLRRHLPDAPLSVNTNGAAYNQARHAGLHSLITTLALHCESLTPATYDHLMTPLRAKNVFPKYEAILRDFPGKVRVSVPVSRANLDELDTIREWFLQRGAREVSFDPLASRCMEDLTLFNALSLAPARIRCSAAVTNDLIVDCDGAVVPCCNDFAREKPIGNLSIESFRETMTNLERRQFARVMETGRHDDIPLCTRCFGDVRTPEFPFDQL